MSTQFSNQLAEMENRIKAQIIDKMGDGQAGRQRPSRRTSKQNPAVGGLGRLPVADLSVYERRESAWELPSIQSERMPGD
eukprot:4904730-Prymnesium_polylepis.1